jgi:Na+/proline symporter/nitrogen-specific signal transduction histidine kinase
MLTANLLLFSCLAYVGFLFWVAFAVDRRAAKGGTRWLGSPIVYTLSLSVYCTSWTFYGAVGSAARNGLEFVTIYLGPTIVFIGWWWLLRKLIRIGRVHRITSIADLISSRFGKSSVLAVIVTILAVVGTTPYIALQLKALTASFQVVGASEGTGSSESGVVVAFWIAAGLAAFTILFGTRSIDANERHHGVVAAIAVESLVKLLALIAVGLFVVFGIGGGPTELFDNMPTGMLQEENIFSLRWVTLTFLSATAIICLPRQFQVTIVENVDERHMATASWLFPLYLMLISLFVIPIAAVGLSQMPVGSNPDMFVLTLPLAANQDALALLAILGGFSSATSMVIVACIALSTMLSNHIVLPVVLQFTASQHRTSGELKELLLNSRRLSILIILFLGYLYFRLSGSSNALASIGLIAFVGVAQLLPSIIGGVFWRSATRAGAISGLLAGFLIWAYTLFLPSFEGGFLMSAEMIEFGPWGIAELRPAALFGLTGLDPLINAMFWSMTANVLLFAGVSLVTEPGPMERLQGTLFVNVFRTSPVDQHRFIHRSATSEDLFVLAQSILGAERAGQLFNEIAASQGQRSGLPAATDAFIARLERELAGSIGAASAHAMVSQIASGETISLGELMKIADETAQVLEYSHQAEQKSIQLEVIASQLREANARLKELDAQKDDFLNQVSHELRTPMTAIRSFSDIMMKDPDLPQENVTRFLEIINKESLRLTRLLDEILDLNILENGHIEWQMTNMDPEIVLDHAIETQIGLAGNSDMRIIRGEKTSGTRVNTDADRLSQVFINLLSNAIKYKSDSDPWVRVSTTVSNGRFLVSFEDNGPGIPREDRERVFAKFTRGRTQTDYTGAGLGLPISRQIMRNLGGEIEILESKYPGATFRVSLRISEEKKIKL